MRCHQLSVLSILTAAPFVNFAKPLAQPWDDIRVKHTWNAVPPNWETLGHPPNDTTINLHVALKPHHESALIDALYEVSDPRSPKYGAHLSRDQVAQLVAPHPNTLELINSWLVHHGVPSSSISTTQGGSWLILTDVPVSQANELLGASYQLYQRTGTNDSAILRTIGYALPAVLHTHVQTVVPTTYFAATRTLRQIPGRHIVGETAEMASRELARSRDDLIFPSDLRWLYRTTAYVPGATDQNVLGIAGYLNDYPSQTDLTMLMTECRTDAVDATFTVVQINGGGNDASHPTTEANLNVQYTQAMAYPTPHIFYSTGGRFKHSANNQPAKSDPFLQWLLYTLNQPKVPQTISIPYGAQESNVPLEYATTLCDMFAKLGVRGVSVLIASGNDGVGEGACMAKDGSDRVQFFIDFPSSCPYVTSVGGTRGQKPEVAASLSGGGFSYHFPRPSYQDDVVPIFLESVGKNHEGLYNPDGRGIPDISAQALGFVVIRKGNVKFVDGTSCATPTVAGIISLLNDYLLSKGMDPLGFLNPWLYGKSRPGLNNIISGSNPGCGTDRFSATVGWDPVTCLGTPDFLNLQARLVFSPKSTTSYASAHATYTSATLPRSPIFAAPPSQASVPFPEQRGQSG